MKKIKYTLISILVGILLSMLIASHYTYYKYNDWWIIGSSKKDIIDRYGAFDKTYQLYCGYYIYDNKEAAVPSEHPIYYWIEFDENDKACYVCSGEKFSSD